MGNNSACLEINPSLPNQETQQLKNNLIRAIEALTVNLSHHDRTELDLFLQPHQSQTQLHNSIILSLQNESHLILINNLDLQKKQRTVLAGIANTHQEINLFREVTKINGIGIVAYSRGYYIGNLKNNLMDGTGTFHFTDPTLTGITLSGSWKVGSLASAWVLKNNIQYLKIDLQETNNARLEFPSVDQLLPTIYRGSIMNLDHSNSLRLEQIMTGEGRISFPNGDRYEGRVVNGLMQTHPSESAIYYSIQAKTTYLGGFKAGKKHGPGILIFRTSEANSQIGTNSYELEVQYDQGCLVEQLSTTLRPSNLKGKIYNVYIQSEGLNTTKLQMSPHHQ